MKKCTFTQRIALAESDRHYYCYSGASIPAGAIGTEESTRILLYAMTATSILAAFAILALFFCGLFIVAKISVLLFDDLWDYLRGLDKKEGKQ